MQEGQGTEPVGSEVPATGDRSLDEVLASVAELGRRPLSEHAAVFEAAQERLRHALDITDRA